MDENEIEYYRFNGGIDIRDRLIFSHMKLTIGIGKNIAERTRRKHRVGFDCEFQELSSVGLAWLTQAVIWAAPHIDKNGEQQESRLRDNDITRYIRSTVLRRIHDFLCKDRSVYMPARTFRSRKWTDAEYRQMCRNEATLDYDAPNADTDKPLEPIARPEEPSLEFIEALDLAVLTDTERRIVDLRSVGHMSKDIAEILGVTRGRITQIMGPIEERFLKLYA